MTGTFLEHRLRHLTVRLQKLRILRQQAVCWLLLLVPAIAVTIWLPVPLGYFRPELPVLMGTTVLGIILSRLLVAMPSMGAAARLVEQAYPELNDAVITAVQVSQEPGQKPSVLSAMAVQEADQLAQQSDWSRVVSGGTLAKWTLLSSLSFLVMVSSVMAASRYGRDLIKPSAEATAVTGNTPSALNGLLVIEPGNTEIERGSALTVVAEFPGIVPTNVVLEFTETNQTPRQLAMTETVDAGIFAARMEGIPGDGIYRVLYADTSRSTVDPDVSQDFTVTTFVKPKLEQVDAVVTPPAWSGHVSETIEDVMRLTVTEGSTVVLKLKLNKPVVDAELQPKTGAAYVLTPTVEDPSIVETSFAATESNSWIVRLRDADGRTPTDDEQISIRVNRNQPADLKVTFPGKDTNVSPLQEFEVEASASDDFGIVEYGLQYSVSGGTVSDLRLMPTETSSASVPISADAGPPDTGLPMLSTAIAHQINLESLNVKPDDIVTYSFWASDVAPDGSVRRSYSDIMFAEVRRFEDIFRESQQGGGQQQSQQQQPQESAADGVLKLQKEIVSATWNTIRSEISRRRGGEFAADVGVIAESQGQAVELLTAATQELADDPQTTALAQRALQEMAAAKQKLEDVRDGKEASTLNEAMLLENTVIYTLLRMRASEFQVQQQQGGGGGGGGGSASQQQMQQLELDNNRNRYETETQAKQQQEQTQAQREQILVLNRLKELARRQQMVNERLKQLESELRAATTDQEREEIERELKRLREEQREMLRDVDDVRERMAQTADRQKPESAQLQQQMEQARENVRQSSRAMDQGNLAEAISEGTRAERQFEQLKEELRRQTSSQFDDAMRDLRNQARELSARQEELARQLSGEDRAAGKRPADAAGSEDFNSNTPDREQTHQPSLRASRDREQLQQDTAQQRDRLNRVVEQTKQIIEQAEQTEPLLSNKLYDTVRELKDSKPEEALQATEMLSSRGLWMQSRQAEQVARSGIEKLKTGIEQAADSILGSEAESLRRAQAQLEDATEKLAGEIQQATGTDAEAGENNSRENGSPNPPSQNETQQSGEGKQSDATSQSNPGPGADGTPSQRTGSQPERNSSESSSESQAQSGQQSASSPATQSSEAERRASSLLNGGRESNSLRGGHNGARPLTGNEFTEWSDQLRDVEEMLDDPELRNRVAQVRDRARAMRAEFKRHGAEPQWDLVKSQLLHEMQALQQRINQELESRESDRAMVPIDREPVPEEFDSLVQKYYELLGHERDHE
ncbi:MAG: hypothetical protein KDB01_04395 [Planctomycetaceae bacterium]|nr:hypothetical protein [Planctomycetaceae bacterium]